MTTRRTAADRRAEAAAHRARTEAAEWELFLKRYPVRFAAVMFTFATDPELRVVRQDDETYTFSLADRGFDWRTRTLNVTPPVAYDYESLTALENLESVVEDLAASRAEEDRKYRVKTAALAKLSKEERELLGL